MSNKPQVSVIGVGRVGSAIARQLYLLGYPLGVLVARNMDHAKAAAAFVGAGQPHIDTRLALAADVIFLTVPDNQITPLCAQLATDGGWLPRHTVIHCSGALGSDALDSAQKAGAAILSYHPLLSISSPAVGAKALRGACFALEGCTRGMQYGRTLVSQLDGIALEVHPGGKPLYHAAAALGSNCLAALIDMVLEMLAAVGVTGEAGKQAACALAAGTIDNINREGLPAALTGPVERGDTATVAKHLDVLSGYPLIMAAYEVLSRRALEMTVKKGSATADELALISQLLTAKELSER